MPRSRSIKRPTRTAAQKKRMRKKALLAFLPETLQAFLARRLVDIFAVLLIGGGLFTLLALLSYNHSDPSWNTASSAINIDIQNWMGLGGAWLSDLLLQTLGIGSFILSAGALIWGIRAYTRTRLRPFSLRILALILSSLAASIALAQIPSGGWNIHPYLGSTFGNLLLERISALSPTLAKIGIPSVFGALSAIVFLFAAAVTRQEIIKTFVTLKTIITTTSRFIYDLVRGFSAWISHHNEPGYTPQWPTLFTRNDIKAFLGKLKKSKSAEDHINIIAPETPAQPSAIAQEEPAPIMPQNTDDIPVIAATASKPPTKDQPEQQRFNLPDGDWDLPTLSLLEDQPPTVACEQLSKEALRKNAELLQNVLADFKIEGEIVSIHPGPVVTLYELEPAPGTKTSRVISLADDIARSMSAVSVRCAVVPGRNVIGIELPNKQRETVYMQELLGSQLFEKTKAKLPLILGKDISGQPILADLSKMPHLLVAGTTGSGKSVAINTMIMSLLYHMPPEKCRFIMIDPKMLELSVYDDIPHLLSPVVTEPGEAIVALKWTVQEMEQRYRSMSKLGVRNIEGYNARVKKAAKDGEALSRKVQTGFDSDTGKPVYEEQAMDLTELPYIVVVVDEFADLMLVAGKDVESAIQRLAQMARAAGIHLIMATQRPSVDVITGVIKANFPTRISFSVTSKVDSRTILGEGGAEQLLGMGDMLYMAPGGRVTRVHGPFISDGDVQSVTDFLRAQSDPLYIDDITDGNGSFENSDVLKAMFGEDADDPENKVDELYDQAVALVAREGKASTSFVQRYLQIGYNRAARIIEEMERQGIISAASPTGKREILVRDFSDV